MLFQLDQLIFITAINVLRYNWALEDKIRASEPWNSTDFLEYFQVCEDPAMAGHIYMQEKSALSSYLWFISNAYLYHKIKNTGSM